MCELRSISDSVLRYPDFASGAHAGEVVSHDGERHIINTCGAENSEPANAVHRVPVCSGDVMPTHPSDKRVEFPFVKFSRVDIILSPEMKRTGEDTGVDPDPGMAFVKSQSFPI